METLQPTEQVPSTEASPCLVKSQTGSITSLTLSDSEEESGYMSCTSGGKKARYSKDIENLLANHSDSSKSLNSSLNDVSSCEPNDSREHSQDDDIDDGDKGHQYDSYHSTANVVLTKVTLLDTPSSPEPQQPEEQLEEGEDSEREDESGDESSDDDKAEGPDQETETVAGEEVDDVDGEEEVEEDEESECEEDNEQEEEECKIRKPLQRQITVISQKEDDDETTSCEEEEDKDLQFPEKKKKRKHRKVSSSSSGTWVSEDDEKCVGVTTKNDDNDSDGPDIGDFFDGMADNVSYKFFEEDNEEVSSYPSREFFTNSGSSPVFGPETMIKDTTDDDDDDFGYIYNSDLKTGKRYAFPRREPRTISDAIDFWETDFEVKGLIYPCMSSWEEKRLAPTYEEDPDDYMKYNMYKSLYDKWVKCNKSIDQWSQRYWGRSIEFVARMKGAPKPPKPTTQSDSTGDDYSTTLPELSSVDQSVADRRRRRRNNTITVTRGMY